MNDIRAMDNDEICSDQEQGTALLEEQPSHPSNISTMLESGIQIDATKQQHTTLEAFEIESQRLVEVPASPGGDTDEGDNSDDDELNDFTGLLPISTTAAGTTTKDASRTALSTTDARENSTDAIHQHISCLHDCCGFRCKRGTLLCCVGLDPVEKVGNMTIFCPALYYKTGWGVYGPDWFGPPCVMLIILVATGFIIRGNLHHDRPFTAAICFVWASVCLYHFVNTAYRDPGLVRVRFDDDQPVPRGYLWCDFCQNYQPPGGAHCPDCNVCVAGYDHHCAWMGTCIGKNNIRPFVRFNLSWLTYLLFAVIWVGTLGPILTKHQSSS